MSVEIVGFHLSKNKVKGCHKINILRYINLIFAESVARQLIILAWRPCCIYLLHECNTQKADTRHYFIAYVRVEPQNLTKEDIINKDSKTCGGIYM